MNIHNRQRHVLLSRKTFSKSQMIYAFQQKPIKSVRMNQIQFTRKFPAKIWENNEK